MTSAPLTSQDLVEQIRARRLAARGGVAPVTSAPIEPAVLQTTAPTPVVAEAQPPVTAPTPVAASEPLPEPIPEPTPTPEPVESVAPPVAAPVTAPEPAPPAPTPDPAFADTDGGESVDLFPGLPRPLPEEIVFEWTAPSRPFKKRQRQYYTTIAIIVVLICLILFFAGQFLPIAVVISVAFLAYVLASVPPDDLRHTITTYGIRVDDQLHYWEELGRFWFEHKYNQPLVHIEVGRFPYRLTLLLAEVDPEEMREILSEVLLEQKPEPTLYDRAAQWIQEKIPLEIDS